MPHQFSMSVRLPAGPQRVFRALTAPREIKAWSAQSGTVRPSIGGRFELFDGWVKGRVLAYDPGRSLAMTWMPAEWAADATPSIVTIRLTPTRTGTTARVIHKGFPSRKERDSHRTGWHEFVFGPLEQYLRRKEA